jgi:integrase
MPLTLFKRGKIYHYRGTVNGARLRGTTGTADRKTAEKIASGIEAAQWKSDLDGPASVLTFSEAAEKYRLAGRSDRFIKRLKDYWKTTLVKDITSGAVRNAAIVICPKGKGATRNRHVIVPTQAIINHAAELGLCPRLKVARFPVETKRKKPATWEWVQAFMAHANPHLAALCCFMFLTGARVTEAINVRWEDVDLVKRKALIRQTKVGAERWAHLPAPLMVAIANIQGERTGKVFKYSTRDTAKPQWNKVIKRAKIEYLTYHSCRHGFATALLHKKIDPITVSKLGGWKSPQHVFNTYGHAMDDDTLSDVIIDTPTTPSLNENGEYAKKSNG